MNLTVKQKKIDKILMEEYLENESLKRLVDSWITVIQVSKISIVDFGKAVKLTLFFTRNQSQFDQWKRLKPLV